jgi:2-dehydro-3-deoxygalactonokinase
MDEFFINCDWGTTRFRLRAIRLAGTEIVAEFCSQDGVARLAASKGPPSTGSPVMCSLSRSDIFQTVLAEGLEQLCGTVGRALIAAPVAISGMASSSIGWQEVPYAPVPFSLKGQDLIWKELEFGGHSTRRRVVLVSGARTESDVMRGEETEALGVFQLPLAKPLADRSILILPGTHSKHLQVSTGRIVDFRTFMTGELFETLSKHSILRHSVDAEEPVPNVLEGASLEAFRAGVEQSQALPLPAALFRVRTRQVLSGLPAETNRSFLSGVLIGSELGYLSQGEWSDQPILLGAGVALQAPYQRAFEALGLTERIRLIPLSDVDRLSALGQQTVLSHLGISTRAGDRS